MTHKNELKPHGKGDSSNMPKPQSKHERRTEQNFISALLHGKATIDDDPTARTFVCRTCGHAFDICTCRKEQ